MANSIETILKAKLVRATQQVPKVLAVEALNWMQANFQRQGFPDDTFQSWPQRKGNTRKGRAILVQTGNLRRSLRIVQVTDKGFIIGSDLPYAKAHNDGVNRSVQVSSHTRNKYTSSKVGTGRLTRSGKERMKTVQTVSGSTQVKSYSRQMRLPRRRFAGNSKVLRSILIKAAKVYIIKSIR